MKTVVRTSSPALATVLVACLLVSSGCFDNRYLAEREYWRAERVHRELLTERNGKLEAGDYPVLIEAYRKVTAISPLEVLSAKAQFTITQFHLNLGQKDEAVQELRRIIQNFSADQNLAPYAQFLIGKIFESDGKFSEAVEAYDKLVDIYPTSTLGLRTPLYLARFQKSIEAGDESDRTLRRAIRHYEHLVDEYTTETSAGVQMSRFLVDTYLEAGQFDEAIKAWDAVLQKNPNLSVRVQAAFYQAQIHATQLKDLPKAIGIFENLLQETFIGEELQLKQEIEFRLGYMYLEDGQRGKAHKLFNALLEAHPDEAQVGILSRFALARISLLDGNFEEAFAEYDRILDLHPNDLRAVNIPFLKYHAYKRVGDGSQAQTLLDEAIREYRIAFQPDSSEPRNIKVGRMLFLSLTEANSWNEALDVLDPLLQFQPRDAGLWFSKAQIHQNRLEDPEQALDTYQAILEKFPNDKRLQNFIRQQIERLRNPGEAPEPEISGAPPGIAG